MSSYYDSNVKCPTCGYSPILCADDTPTRHEYTYICEKCGYRTQDYEKLTNNKDKMIELEEEYNKLADAAAAIYYAGYWTCDRPVNGKQLWEDLRDALGLGTGTSPEPINKEKR